MFKRILVPLDGSQLSARALPYAFEIAQRFGAEVILLQVVEVPSAVSLAPAGVGISTVATELAKEATQTQERRNIARARRYLSNKLRSITTRGINGSFQVVTGTSPAKSILEFCKKEGVDLVVMTTSGKGGLKRALLGSVADQLIRDPSVPELVIRPQMERKK